MAEKELAEGEERLVALPEGTRAFVCLEHFKRAVAVCSTAECLENLNPQCEFADRFTSLLIDYMLRSKETWELCKGDLSKLPVAMQSFSPYCCHLGEEKLEVFYTLARDRGFGRSGSSRIGWVQLNPTAQLPTSLPKDVM